MLAELAQARRSLEAGDLKQAQRLYNYVVNAEPQNKDAWHELGVLALRAGQPQPAVDCLRRAVALDGAAAEFHNHLGVALASAGQADESIVCFRRAVELDGHRPDAHYNLAKALGSAGQLEEAAAHYQASIKLDPNAPEVHYNLGNTLRELRRPDEAAASYREAIRLRPGYVKAYTNLGNVLREQGRLDQAAAQHREAIRIRPDYVEGYHNLGLVLTAQGRLDDAVNVFGTALGMRPGFPAARNGLAKALIEQGKLDEATALLQTAATIEAECVGAYLKLGDKLRQAGRVDEAIQCARKVLEAKSDQAVAHHNLGLALLAKGQLEEALGSYRRALEIRSDFAEVHNNLAVALHTLGRFDEGLEHIDRALCIRPGFAVAHLNRAVTWLREGDFERGWQEFEWRRMCADHRIPRYGAPMWDGSPLPEGTILLHAEQGLGDTLHMIRYAPLVKARCRTLLVQCQKVLLPLLKGCAGIDHLVSKGERLPECQAQLPLMSLPLVLRTAVADIPAEVPYLAADERLVEAWRGRMAQHQGFFKVGIAWQGNKKYAGDRWRSIALKHFAALGRVPGVRLFSLQKGVGAEQVAELPEELRPIDFGPDFDAAGAFVDTAAVMQHLDLVITSDTAIPHLAGALGRPVWVALSYASDWRWLDDREDSPWYPTMRLFRQVRLDEWEPLFARLANELAAVAGGDTSRVRARPSPAAPLRAPIAAGELADKLTILRIKSERITDVERRQNVERELQQLTAVYERSLRPSPELTSLLVELKSVNEQLWQVEDEVRCYEARGEFGERFVALARSVYATNDRRTAIKRQIDLLVGSPLMEEKQYAGGRE